MRTIDIKDLRFHRWTVIEKVARPGERLAWKCRCDCGNERIVAGTDLRSGHSRSCGCLGHEETRERLTRHGMTGHPLFRVWKGMHTRCGNPNFKQARDYIERGIRVCRRWSKFENFLADMGPRPANRSLDRINTDGHYTPNNCRWATSAEQYANRRVHTKS